MAVPFLSGLSVLWLASTERTEVDLNFLSREGAAVVRVDSAREAVACARLARVDVLVVDCADTEAHAGELLQARKSVPELRRLPAIAVNVDRATGLPVGDGGFIKLLCEPVRNIDVAVALASAAGAARVEPEHASSFELLPHLEQRIAKRDLRGALALLNATAGFRYTSAFRFDEGNLTSVWTYDREAASADGFPLTVTVDDSYCCYVRDSKAPFVVTEASRDERVATHPKRFELQAYCGVPILREDASLFGSLCHYDQSPRVPGEGTVHWLEEFAKRLPPLVAAAS